MGVTAGQKLGGQPYLQTEENKSAAAWTIGDALYQVSNAWVKCPTTATTSPFAMAADTRASGDAKGPVVTDGVVTMTAGAAIGVGKYVQSDTTTPGRIMEWAGTLPNAIIGRYLGKPNQVDGKTVQTAAAAGEVIWVKLGTAGGVGVS